MNALMAASPDDRRRLRRSISTFLRGERRGPEGPCLPGPAGRGRDGPAVPHRRLHRLLHQHPPRDDRRQAVPSRQPAAAELQVGADRLSRPCLVDRRQRRVVSVAPTGRSRPPTRTSPSVGPTRRLDYELEIGVFIGTPNARGEAVTMDDAESRVFGMALFNDWTARDIQAVGVPAARPVPVEELRQHAVALDRDDGGAGTVSQRLSCGRKATRRPLPYLESDANNAGRRVRHPTRGVAADAEDARGGPGGRTLW